MTRSRATAIGFVAVLLWALLALFTVGTAPTPPLLLNAISFTIGGGIGMIWVARTGGFARLRAISWKIYAFGTLGLFGYHALYFSALRLAPAAEAGLIAYLWPLLIVLFSGLLPGERLRRGHLVGALCGFAGAALIIAGGSGAGFDITSLPGYLLALAGALTWAGYSVISRHLGAAPTATVAVFCVATAILSAGLHLVLEETIWPATPLAWASALALGLGPVGLAFYVWDIGVKRGDIQLLGTASYAAPLLSTLILVGVGVAEPTWLLAAATVLITGGAILAARASLRG
ncbi:aromatic amino acid exporter YddG [Thiosulfatihalobacter marinus]|uniref:aromatic amino acid exporter YddG n=1 Tax=Thiosulfatihalobacter marinus TaxID=2792481 RepID=UPI0018D87890|nr:EamA family transporter [Thiosulfatihalobacter marinus]